MTNHIVSIVDFDFVPQNLTVKNGDNIVWTNNGQMGHTASRDDVPNFDTGILQPGESSRAVVIDAAAGAVLDYFCRPHRAMMRGKIQVA